MRDISTVKYIYYNYKLGGWGDNYMVGLESRIHWILYEKDLDQNSIDYLPSDVLCFNWSAIIMFRIICCYHLSLHAQIVI